MATFGAELFLMKLNIAVTILVSVPVRTQLQKTETILAVLGRIRCSENYCRLKEKALDWALGTEQTYRIASPKGLPLLIPHSARWGIPELTPLQPLQLTAPLCVC